MKPERQSEACAVCGDKASGKHYGAISCNACKNFFCRVLLQKKEFECRLNRRCIVEKDLRLGCKYCRLQKCLLVGMKREVDNGETSSKKSRKEDKKNSTEEKIIDRLVELEKRMNEEIHSRFTIWKEQNDTEDICHIKEMNELSRISLDLIIDWAKAIWPFAYLDYEDQCHLIRHYAPQHLVLLSRHSPHGGKSEGNVPIHNQSPERETLGDQFYTLRNDQITRRVLDDLVWPLRKLQLQEEEFICLKVLVFLSPEAKYLSEKARNLIREARTRLLSALYEFLQRKETKSQQGTNVAIRFGNIILEAQALQRVTQIICQNMKMVKFFGLIEIDEALSEFIVDYYPCSKPAICSRDDLTTGPSKEFNNGGGSSQKEPVFEDVDALIVCKLQGMIDQVVSNLWADQDSSTTEPNEQNQENFVAE